MLHRVSSLLPSSFPRQAARRNGGKTHQELKHLDNVRRLLLSFKEGNGETLRSIQQFQFPTNVNILPMIVAKTATASTKL